MKRSTINTIHDLAMGIDRNYPFWPSTFGNCLSEGCDNPTVNSGRCADCYEIKLAELVGALAASNYHDAVKERAEAYEQMKAKVNKPKDMPGFEGTLEQLNGLSV